MESGGDSARLLLTWIKSRGNDGAGERLVAALEVGWNKGPLVKRDANAMRLFLGGQRERAGRYGIDGIG